jgi:hypothetical protein
MAAAAAAQRFWDLFFSSSVLQPLANAKPSFFFAPAALGA